MGKALAPCQPSTLPESTNAGASFCTRLYCLACELPFLTQTGLGVLMLFPGKGCLSKGCIQPESLVSTQPEAGFRYYFVFYQNFDLAS